MSSAGLTAIAHKVLLTCGILAALVTVGADLLGGLVTTGYHFGSQSASLLTARGATSRALVLTLDLLGGMLLIAFAVGVWCSTENAWALRTMACLLAGNAILSMVAVTFYPLRADAPTNAPANLVNAVVMGMGVFSFLFAMVFGAVGNQNWFRYYTIANLLAFALLTVLSLTGVIAAPAGRSQVGAQERTMVYSEMLWLALQAVVLLRA